MGTSVALAMGTRWFIFARAFAQRRQTRKGHGARGTGVARATQASIHPMLWLLYGLLYQASVLRPRALKPEEAWSQQGQHEPNFKKRTRGHSKEHHLWRPASRTLTGARSHRQPPHVDMMISLNEDMSGSGQGGQGARAGEAWWGVGTRKQNKTKKQKSGCVARQSKGHCKAAVPDLEQAQEAPGSGLVRTMYSSVEQQEVHRRELR